MGNPCTSVIITQSQMYNGNLKKKVATLLFKQLKGKHTAIPLQALTVPEG